MQPERHKFSVSTLILDPALLISFLVSSILTLTH